MYANSWTFTAHRANILKSDVKSTEFVIFGAKLTQLEPK